jgi:hypothetical protein
VIWSSNGKSFLAFSDGVAWMKGIARAWNEAWRVGGRQNQKNTWRYVEEACLLAMALGMEETWSSASPHMEEQCGNGGASAGGAKLVSIKHSTASLAALGQGLWRMR